MAGQTIQIKTASGKQFSAYLATPETGKGPGVVLCQEIFGVNAAMREKADFLAEEGYTVLVPDLFWRVAPNMTYVKNMKPISPYSRVTFNIIPEVGEYFSFPALTINGPCDIMVFEGIPNGPMDCWQDVKTPEQHLQCSLDLLKKFVPWEYERCANVELTDAGGYLAGRFPPTVRKPVLTLPSGKKIFGMADALVVNDPITGQGSNNAAKCSKIYFDAILANDNQSFSEQWMVQTFERYWAYAEKVVAWTNSLLLPPEPHVVELLAAASQNQSIASIMANNFDDPRAFAPWWFDANQAQAFLASKNTAKVA
ncbi:styrene monooxygenase/indole monooxygenase family protein [Acinetobacter baumannii]|uniref:styrene monooxygenase/indole monooxygenase family protein n=1 Tax=Acinetobacter baumannii TaxID=470 RepID=UPI003CCFE130